MILLLRSNFATIRGTSKIGAELLLMWAFVILLHSFGSYLCFSFLFSITAMDRSRSRDLALRGSRELYSGAPATARSTPVINRRRPVIS
jgi:hypothetical protein